MQQIGEYFIHRLIGEGGMGKVYEAEERLSRRRVALKVLREDLARSEDGRRLFLREMTILSHLDHPNVVRCLACTEVGESLVMVLEHMVGQTLREVLRQRVRIAWCDALGIAGDVAAGLAAAHGHQPAIIHRDLKPENVMVLADGRCKVMDFGIAKILDAAGPQTVFTVGTLQYMSPEQIEGLAVDPRADLYCLGLLLYEMLAGRPPFASDSPRELLNLHCTQAPPRLAPELTRTFPPGLEAFLFSLLEKDRDRRPPNADAVLRTISQLRQGGGAVASALDAAGRPVVVPAPSTSTIMLVERAGAAQRRGHVLRTVLAIGGAVLLLGGGVTALVIMSPDGTAATTADESTATSPAPAHVDTKAETKKAVPQGTPAANPSPNPRAVDTKAEAVRRQALADREAADAAQRSIQSLLSRDDGESVVSSVLSRLRLDDAKPGDAKSGDAKRGDAKPDDAKPDDAKPGDASLVDIFRQRVSAKK